MRNLAGLLVLSALVIAGCGDTADEKIISDVKVRVIEMLRVNYGGCEPWKVLKGSSDAHSRNTYFSKCDSSINPSGAEFSEVKLYRHKNFSVVCGVVSGRTDVSRQGMRFVLFWDRDDWSYLRSRYSGGKQPPNDATSFWRYHNKYCKS